MPAHKVPLKIEQGATFDQVYTWKAGAPKTATPVDLTGCAALAQFHEEIESAAVLLELSTTDGRLVLGNPSVPSNSASTLPTTFGKPRPSCAASGRRGAVRAFKGKYL